MRFVADADASTVRRSGGRTTRFELQGERSCRRGPGRPWSRTSCRSSDDAARAERSFNLELGRAAQFSKQWHVGGVCITTGVKLRGPEGAQRPRATSASTSELYRCRRVGSENPSFEDLLTHARTMNDRVLWRASRSPRCRSRMRRHHRISSTAGLTVALLARWTRLRCTTPDQTANVLGIRLREKEPLVEQGAHHLVHANGCCRWASDPKRTPVRHSFRRRSRRRVHLGRFR